MQSMVIASGWSIASRDFRLIYESGATTFANFCYQVTTEQFDKFQLTQKHVIMLVKAVGYRHYPLVKGFKIGLNVSVSGLRCFIESSRWLFLCSIFIMMLVNAAVAALSIHEIMFWQYGYIFTEQCKFIICSRAFQSTDCDRSSAA